MSEDWWLSLFLVSIGRFCRHIRIMAVFPRSLSPWPWRALLGAVLLGAGGCHQAPAPLRPEVPPPPLVRPPPAVPSAPSPPVPAPVAVFPVMLGIDVLEAN